MFQETLEILIRFVQIPFSLWGLVNLSKILYGLSLGGSFLRVTVYDLQAEIVETTFRSRFRFRFLKYPLFKKVVSFRVPKI